MTFAGSLSFSQRALALLYLTAAIVSLLIGVAPVVGVTCRACAGGMVSLCLPWIGLMFYLSIAVAVFRGFEGNWLGRIPGFYLFVHACLITEMLLIGHFCLGCLVVAAVAFAAAGVQLHRVRKEWIPCGIAIALGVAAAFFTPLERIDDLLTRVLWPARVLEVAPPWVERGEMATCEHGSAIRLLIYEKNCRTCSSAANQIVPRLKKDFPGQVCIHLHERPRGTEGQRYPVFIMVTRQFRVMVVEGMPDYDMLKETLLQMLKLPGETRAAFPPKQP